MTQLTWCCSSYPASVAGYDAGGCATGTAELVRLIKKPVGEQPYSNIFLVGYSQGAQVVHNALDYTSADDDKHIAGILLFGDPFHHGSSWAKNFQNNVASKVRTFANERDPVTKSKVDIGNIIRGLGNAYYHLQYESSVPEAVGFIVQWSNSR